jgi:N-acetylglutamate synthase-like GNAT family acetyltransferase
MSEIIRIATERDMPRIVELLNMAYRGDASRKGWTTEADLIAGEVRADEAAVGETMHLNGSVFLVFEQDGKLQGCMNLQKHGERMYLGMFAVNPDLQGSGIGKKLLKSADVHALEQECRSIYMKVIAVRTELIQWYQRHGYEDTGERVEFQEDGRTGKHLQTLEFATLEKSI